MSRSTSVFPTPRARVTHRPLGLYGGLGAVFAASTAISACLNFDPFSCQDAGQCDAEMGGQCEPAGYCSYPDLACMETGQRFEDNAGDGLGGQCVGVSGTETETDESSGGSTEPNLESSSSGTDPTTDPDTTGDSESTGTGEQCGGAGQPCCDPDDSCEVNLECQGATCGCITGVIVGDRHSCATKVDGSLWCWGDNALGQLSTGEPEDSLVPVQIDGFGSAQQADEVRARNHTCALRSDGDGLCWGDNTSLKSDPDSALGTSPITTITWATDVQRLGVGGTHTCAAQGGGLPPVCWGSNAQGQITGTPGPGPGPQMVGGVLDMVEEFALGNTHTCLRTSPGDLFCWGNNASGQLGLDPLVTPLTGTVTQLSLLSGVDAVVAGSNHTCALVDDAVACWGNNGAGQLGVGGTTNDHVPMTITFPPEAGSIGTIVAAANHTCAVTMTGDLYCWGSNNNGQLKLTADPMTGDDSSAPTPSLIELEVSVSQIATGVTHTCIQSTDGQLLCWGRNNHGEIGDGTTDNAIEPTPVALACP